MSSQIDPTKPTSTHPRFSDMRGNFAAAKAEIEALQGFMAFKTIAVPGQADIVADSAADTLTLVAGANITLTTDAATDSVTIAATGGGVGYALSGDNYDITSLQNVHGSGGDPQSVSIGTDALSANTTGYCNTAVGESALRANTTGYYNTAVGEGTLSANTTGSGNTAVGDSALIANTTGEGNTAVGDSALIANTYGGYNIAVGYGTLGANTTGGYNIAMGYNALGANTIGGYSIAIGNHALSLGTTGAGNIAVGYSALRYNTTGNLNVAVGDSALRNTTDGLRNVAVGYGALIANTTGSDNTAVGESTLSANTTGSANVAIGKSALRANIYGNNNVAIGYNALYAHQGFSNCSGIGSSSIVTGGDQVQLGNSGTTTYTFGAVQDRSDIRDKADIRDTVLGLGFINALRPVDYRLDMRDDYRPDKPAPPVLDMPDESSNDYARELEAYEKEQASHKLAMDEWVSACALGNIVHDGTKKRSRFHHGLIAQEVREVVDSTGVDFGGFQDHSIKGGDDVMSIGYNELVAPLIKAVQELSARLAALEKLMPH